MINNRVVNTKTFIQKAKELFPQYDYSQTVYVKSKEKVKIICPTHGEFFITPNSLLRGSGCAKCKFEKESKLFQYTTEEFVKLAKDKHGDRYDYSLVSFPLPMKQQKVPIICKKHGMFYQGIHNHLTGSGCPKCKSSRGENLIMRILDKCKIDYIKEYSVKICNKTYRIDFYLPGYKVAIEYNGILHYIPVKCFGGIKLYIKRIIRDIKIKNYCRKNEIDLIVIKYNDNVDKKLKKVNVI